MSLAWEICRIAEGEVGRAALRRVREVGVEVGTESGVEPESLEFCLEALLSRPPFGAARPVLEILEGEDDLRVAWLEIEDEEDASEPGASPAASAPPPRFQESSA